MKILLCHNYYQLPGGESEVFENEVRGLTQMGEKLFVYERRNTVIEPLSPAKKIGVFLSSYYSQESARDLRKIIREEKPDVAIVQNVFPLLSPSVYLTLSAAKIPIIQAVYNYRLICPSAELYTEGAICERCVVGNTVHAVIHKCYRGSYALSAWYASIIGWHRRAGTFARKITSFMVPDNFLGTELVRGGIPPPKIWSNPNPFFVHDYQPQATHGGYVLYIGRLLRQKGILTLLSAMEQVHAHSRLVIVGSGELADQIVARLKSPNLCSRVTLLAPRWGAEVMSLMRESAAVVIPSEWYDNLPLVLCQANAMGKPVIVSRIDGIPEYVVDGRNGSLFEPGNAKELAGLIDGVIGLSTVEYAHLSGRARAFAEEVFDYPRHYANLISHIEGIRDRNEPP